MLRLVEERAQAYNCSLHDPSMDLPEERTFVGPFCSLHEIAAPNR